MKKLIILAILIFAVSVWAAPPAIPPGPGADGANANAYYLLLRATNAPTNATSLGGLTTGLVLCTVADSVCTPSTVAITADGTSLITAADYAAMKALLDLEIGTDVQAYDANTLKYEGTPTGGHAAKFNEAGDAIVSGGAPVAMADDIVTGLLRYNSVSGEVENVSTTLTENLETTGYLAGKARGIIVLVPSGVHDGDNDAAIMTDGGIDIGANALVGMTVYNKTDGSSCTITANAATTITCTLAGGTGNDWDTSDVWQVGPGPAQSGSIFYVASAGTLRHPATIGYVAGYYATAAASIIVNPAADTMVITHATAAAIDAGDAIDSPATAGSFIWLHNASATLAYTHGKNGTWTDGGAD